MDKEDLQGKLDLLYQRRQDLEALRGSRGYKVVLGLVQEQCRLRRMEVFGVQVSGLDACFRMATLQGEVSGLQTLSALLDLCVEDTQMDIARVKQELDENA